MSELWADAELAYKPSADTKFYIRGKTADYTGSSSNTVDRTEKHITCGFNTAFDSSLSFAAYGKAEGFVFVDKNGNGVRDRGEEGVSGAKIFVKDRNFVVSDKDGWYSVKSLPAGKASVGIDMTSVDSRNILTTPSPADTEISSNSAARVDFGIRMVSSLKGRVFADKNANRAFDQGDRAIPNFPVYIDGTKYVTDFEGKFFVHDIGPGRHTVILDPKDLPAKMLPLVPINTYVDVEEGVTTEFNIPFKFSGTEKIKKTASKSKAKRR